MVEKRVYLDSITSSSCSGCIIYCMFLVLQGLSYVSGPGEDEEEHARIDEGKKSC